MRCSIVGATPQQVRTIGGTGIREAKAVKVVFAELTEAQVIELRRKGFMVNRVKAVKPIIAPPTPVEAEPIYRPQDVGIIMGFEEVRGRFDPPLYGAGYNMAVVGTGIRRTHQLVSGRVVYSKNYTSAPDGDQFDHDTAVAAVALSWISKCNLLDYKVMDESGEGDEELAVLAIDDCINLHEDGSEHAPHVINLSLGSPDDGDPDNILRIACRAAIDRGIWVIAAAGNGGPNPGTIVCPACEQYVFATGSAKYLPDQRSFVVSDFSSRGPTKEGLIKPDVVMFGEDLIVASSATDTATVAKSGTSFSAPFSSAAVIVYFEASDRLAAYMGGTLPGFPPRGTVAGPISMEEAMDEWLPKIAIKPSGVAAAKDNDYGAGLPFGPQMLEVVGMTGALGIDLSQVVPMIAMIGMMGIMMKVMAQNGQRHREGR